MIVLMVALGAAIGAPARYLTDRAVQSRHNSTFPWGTLAVNVAASLVLGAVVGGAAHLGAELQALLATGFCGALSTFSTFSYETVRLSADGRIRYAVANATISVLAALGAGSLGYALASAW